jgi:hypothetical protein
MSLNCGHQRAYCSSQHMICKYVEPQWNDDTERGTEELGKNLSQSHADLPGHEPGPPR